MFSWSAINSDLMRTLFNLPVHIALHVGNNIHGSLNIPRLTLFDLHFKLMHHPIAPGIASIYRKMTGFLLYDMYLRY